VCAQVGNQRSRGVVTALVQTDAVRSLPHQRRDLNQSTYLYLSEDRDQSTVAEGGAAVPQVGYRSYGTSGEHR
jgi:hypothetical protein